ncbi:hypothetical protein Mapa_006107 [Marchantia paleacea]|nr:hypothetical protein Mapa_006107 [Marchantia paleacea]
MTKQCSNVFQWQHAFIFLTLALAVYVSSRSLPSESDSPEKCKPTFVLVHGAGMGGWCWFKIMSELKQQGFDAVAIDLAAAGIHPADANSVTTIAQLAQPLVDFVANFSDQNNLILVGHSMGGISISRAMELYPEKVQLAVYVAAVMPLDGDNFYQTLTKESQNAKNDQITLVFTSPDSAIPTSGFLKQENIKKVLLNRSPPEDVELVKLLYRPVAFGPTLDTIHLTPERYGVVEKHYIKLLDDFGFFPRDQQHNIDRNSEGLGSNVYTIDSDHAVQLSHPKTLTDMLVAILNKSMASEAS